MIKLSPIAGALIALLVSVSALADDRPNIVLIVSDDHAPMLGAYGDTYATTPNLDALAEQGVLFENAYSNAPVCAPARNTLITGMYPTSLGTENMRSVMPIPEDVVYFPKHLAAAGYYTVNVAKHDFNFMAEADSWSERIGGRGPSVFDWDRTRYYRETGGDKPFLAIINLTIAHESKVMVDFDGNRRDLSKTRHDPMEVPLPAYYPDTMNIRQALAQYYDNVEDVDTAVGGIMASLKRDGLADNTIVMFVADHGTGVPRGKRAPNDSGLRIPMLVHVPDALRDSIDAQPGSRRPDVVSFVDIAPTILSLAGVAVPDYMQGRVFMGPGQQEAPEYAFGFRGRMDERIDLVRAASDGRFHYMMNLMPHLPAGQFVNTPYRIHPVMREWHRAVNEGGLSAEQSAFFMKKPAEELYDLHADPSEVRNLAGDPAYAKKLEAMRRATLTWMQQVRDVGLLGEPEIFRISETGPVYDWARERGNYNFYDLAGQARLAASATAADMPVLLDGLKSDVAPVRYWSLTGLLRLGATARPATDAVRAALQDESAQVRGVAAEVMCGLHQCAEALPVLGGILETGSGAEQLYAANVIDRLDRHAASLQGVMEATIERKEAERKASTVGKSSLRGNERGVMNKNYADYVQRVLRKAIWDLDNRYPFESRYESTE